MKNDKPTPEPVFELVELQQCEDYTFTLGLFHTLEEAVALVEENGVGLCTNDPDEWAGVEIRGRHFGMCDNGKVVWSRIWERNFPEEDAADDQKERWKIYVPSKAKGGAT